MLLITIEDENSEKFGDTVAKEMSKALVETPVEVIEMEKVETVGQKLKDLRGRGTSEHTR